MWPTYLINAGDPGDEGSLGGEDGPGGKIGPGGEDGPILKGDVVLWLFMYTSAMNYIHG